MNKDVDRQTQPQSPEADMWETKIAGALAFLRRRLAGEYEIDEFGFDLDLFENIFTPPFRQLYEKWFRIDVNGMENVPTAEAALVVANHSGVLPLDGAMLTIALLDHHPAKRPLRMLVADLAFRLPFFGEAMRKAGFTLGCPADAERLLTTGQLVGVFPEGYKGVGKLYSDRYKLQRFGRGGFVASALAAKAPIIPCAIVGAEETYPMVHNATTLARLFGLPYFPITPTFPLLGPLGLVPLPSKWVIEFSPPIETARFVESGQADDPSFAFNLSNQIRETIQQTISRLLEQRGPAFQ